MISAAEEFATVKVLNICAHIENMKNNPVLRKDQEEDQVKTSQDINYADILHEKTPIMDLDLSGSLPSLSSSDLEDPLSENIAALNI